MKFNEDNARVEVLTFKEGILSSVAHDLRIVVHDFELSIEDEAIHAEIDLRSLKVACARKAGVDAPQLLTTKDHVKIEATMRDEVLHTSKYPWAVLDAELDELDDGDLPCRLELHGQERDVVARLSDEPEGLHVTLAVHQPDFGIKPYSAMLGSLKVKATVQIVVILKGLTIASLEEASG